MKYQILTIGGEAYLIDATDMRKIQATLETSKFINVAGVLIATHQVKAVLPIGLENKKRNITFLPKYNEHQSIEAGVEKQPELNDKRMGFTESQGKGGGSESSDKWVSIQSSLSKTIKHIP